METIMGDDNGLRLALTLIHTPLAALITTLWTPNNPSTLTYYIIAFLLQRFLLSDLSIPVDSG